MVIDMNEEKLQTLARLEPLEFMQRLAALVPRQRLRLTRFHGVLAPNAKLRAKVVLGARNTPLKQGAVM